MFEKQVKHKSLSETLKTFKNIKLIMNPHFFADTLFFIAKKIFQKNSYEF